MNPVWAQRREEVWNDCLVSPDVFTQMVNRLGEFVVPYQHALETEVNGRHVHLYLQGLLSALERKNAEKIATFVDVVAPGHPRLHRHGALGSSSLGDRVSRTSGRAVGRTRWHHRLRSQ